jgi:hypothetical protein
VGNSTLKRFGWNRIGISAAEIVQRAPFANCSVVGGVLSAEIEPIFRNTNMSRIHARPQHLNQTLGADPFPPSLAPRVPASELAPVRKTFSSSD